MYKRKLPEKKVKKEKAGKAMKSILSWICVIALFVTMVLPSGIQVAYAEDNTSTFPLACKGDEKVTVTLIADQNVYKAGETATVKIRIVNETDEVIDAETAGKIGFLPSFENEELQKLVGEFHTVYLNEEGIDAKGGKSEQEFRVTIPKNAPDFETRLSVEADSDVLYENFEKSETVNDKERSILFKVEAADREKKTAEKQPEKKTANQEAIEKQAAESADSNEQKEIKLEKKIVKSTRLNAPVPGTPSYNPVTLNLDAETNKCIDYLGDNVSSDDNNPDTALDDEGVAGLKDVYRLYLNAQAKSEGIDLLLVLDQSGSMTQNKDMKAADKTAITRQEAIDRFLNGENKDGTGFIKQFLAANDKNSIAISTFSDDSTPEKNYIQSWSSSVDSVSLPSKTTGATNYAAGMNTADEILKEKSDSSNKKIVIFLGDGMPTVAYNDGSMDCGTGNTGNYKMFGSGSEKTELDAASLLMEMTAFSNGEHFKSAQLNLTGSLPYYNFLLPADGDMHGFPVYFNLADAMNIPGVSLDDEANLIVTDDAAFDAFVNDYPNDYFDYIDGLPVDLSKYFSNSKPREYDLFACTEQAADQFRASNEDVALYTIGFASEEDLAGSITDANGASRSKSEVLAYMASSQNKGYEGKYYYAGSADSLSDSINNILFMKNVTIQDTLTEWVDFADNPDVVVKDDAGNVLYEKGAVTAAGKNIVDSVSISGKTIKVTFQPSYAMDPAKQYSASFNIKVNDAAYAEYVKDGESYPDEGSADSDYGTNKTSSGKDGFFSNTEEGAKISWTSGDDEVADEEMFNRPVVQVDPRATLEVKKVDGNDTSKLLSGAAFEIYQDDGDGIFDETKDLPAVTYTDASLKTEGGNPTETDSDGLADFYGLRLHMDYWIVETHAPDGYSKINEATKVNLTNEQLTDGKFQQIIKNYPIYRLPNAGGIGIYAFAFLGSLMMSFVVWRIRRKVSV